MFNELQIQITHTKSKSTHNQSVRVDVVFQCVNTCISYSYLQTDGKGQMMQ